MTRDSLINLCRYYRGEVSNPYYNELRSFEVDKSHLPPPECMHIEYAGLSREKQLSLEKSSWFWNYEERWVSLYLQGDSEEINRLIQIGSHLVDSGSIPVNDGVPLSLKALFYNRYEHTRGGSDGFMELYAHY